MHKLAGLFFSLAGISVVMGIISAEIFYPPGYSISLNMISTLASTPPPTDIVHEPSAAIFDNSLILAGSLVVLGSLLIKSQIKSRLFVLSLITMGLGVLGVGIFPAFHKIAHPISALVAFAAGGVAAILSFKNTTSPFNYLSVILGSISLVFLSLGTLSPQNIVPILGNGGTERWVAYPILLWLTVYGGYQMGRTVVKK